MPITKFKNLEYLKNQLKLIEHIENPSVIEYWASVHLIFHRRDSNSPLSLAMIRRVKNEKDPWSGHYAFPGGGVNRGESLKEASLRETMEEIGLIVPYESYIGEFYRVQVHFDGKPAKLAISAHASLMEGVQLPQLSPCPIEVDEAFWFPLNHLLAKDSIFLKEFDFSNTRKELPCISFDGHLVWGLSYMIFREFLLQWEVLSEEIESSFIDKHLPDYPYGKHKK